MLSNLRKWGTKRPDDASPAEGSRPRGDEPVVPSKALPKFLTALSQQTSPILVDLGPVIGPNVEFFGERLGCKLFIEDLVADVDRHLKGGTLENFPASLEKRFRHADQSVTGVLCWDLFDFLDKPSAEALAKQIVRMLGPGGAMMGFFCTSSVPHAAFTKFEIVDDTNLRHRQHPGVGGQKRALNNRDIIKMFEGLIVSDSFLLKSNTRENLLRRK
jgi:hypothetical protein